MVYWVWPIAHVFMPLCVCTVPDSPESTKAVVIAQHPDKSVIQVSWKPPKDGTHIDKYLVAIRSHQVTTLLLEQPMVPGVSLCIYEHSAYHLCWLVIFWYTKERVWYNQTLSIHSQNTTDYTFTLNGTWSASDQLYAQVGTAPTLHAMHACILIIVYHNYNIYIDHIVWVAYRGKILIHLSAIPAAAGPSFNSMHCQAYKCIDVNKM